MPGKPPLTAQDRAIDPVAAVRLRAAGLDPADPNFAARLNERLTKPVTSSPTPAPWKPGVGPTGPAGTGSSPNTESMRATLLAKLNDAPAGARSAFYGGANLHPSETLRMPGALSQNLPLAASGLYTGLVPQSVHDPVVIPMIYGLTFMTPTGVVLPTQFNHAGLVHLSIPDCHAEADAFASVVTRDSPSASGFSSQLPIMEKGTGVAFFLLLDDTTHGSAWTMPLGASTHPGTITLHYGNYVASVNRVFSEGAAPPEYHALTVSSAPPLLSSGNDMGLKEAAFALQSPTVRRFNATRTPMTGVDIIGVGTRLGPSFAVTAQVTASHSVSDVGGDSSADNQYRGATVTTQPGAGRFETQVQWHIGPGDSLQYTIQWDFSGLWGQRPLLTMPLRGPCDS